MKNIRGLKFFLIITAVLVLYMSGQNFASAQGSVQQFQTEQSAQAHCPADTVVWVNTKSGVYHFKGERWYGATKAGAYVCQKEGDKAGFRATRNGQ